MKQENNTETINTIGEQYFEIIRKKTLWIEYTYNAKEKATDKGIISKMKVLNSPIKVQIPKKENIRYLHIKNIEDYNLSNNLALDMIIRNEEFKNLMYYIAIIDEEFKNKAPELKEKHYRKLQQELIKNFGFNIKEEINLIAHHPYINEQISNHLDNIANKSIVLNPPFISDIKNGLKRVINFYLEKKKLYKLIPPTHYEIINNGDYKNINKKRLFAKIINPTNYQEDYILLSVYEDNQKYLQRIDKIIYLLPEAKMELIDKIDDNFIKNNLNYLGIPAVTFGTEKIVSLAENPFPIEFLDEEFKTSLSEDDIFDSFFNDSEDKPILPKLKLPNSKRISSTINSNLPSNEQIEKIANLKINSKNIKSFTDIFNKKVDDIEKTKNTNFIAKNKEKRNRDYSDAFFIYDLYKIIGSKFKEKISDLEQEAKINKEKIEKNVQYGKEAKKHEYDKIIEKLENNKSLFSKTILDQEIQKITNIEISKLRGLHSLMQEYIDDYNVYKTRLDLT